MKPPPTTLVTLVDRVLLPAASLTELPDLSIEPLKVQELILDYLSEQDCPGAVAHLQRDLGKSSRQPRNNHSASRLVQLVAKGLIYEKNVPRLDSILQGCNDIIKSVEDGPAHHSAPQPIPQNFISNSQSQQQPLLRPQPRQPQTRQLNPIHSLEVFSSDSSKPGQEQTPTSEFERPPLTESRTFNVLLPSFPASLHQTAILPLNGPIPGIGTSCSTQSLPISPAPNFDTKPHSLDSISLSGAPHADSLVSAHTFKRTFHQREQNNSLNVTLAEPSEQPSRSSSGQLKQQSDTRPSDFSRASKKHLVELEKDSPKSSALASSSLGPPALTIPTGPNGGWQNINNDAVCLSPKRRFSANIPHVIGAAGDEAEDVKPDLRRYLKQKTPPSIDGTALLTSPRISSKRTVLSQVGRGSPPPKKPRINGKREDTSIRREELSRSSHFPLACQTSSMLYGLSDADLPGTPPEMSPHIGSRTLPESVRSDREPPFSADRHNLSKVLEDESAKDLSDVGTPRGSPPEIAIPSVDFDPSIMESRCLIEPLVVTSGDELKDLNVDTEMASPIDSSPAENHKLPTTVAIHQTLLASSNDPEDLTADTNIASPLNPSPVQHSHMVTASIDQARRYPGDQSALACQVKVSKTVIDSSTAPSVAIMEELRAKLLASRKSRSTTVPIPTPVMAPPAPTTNIAPSEPSHHVTLSLEQNLRAQLRSRQAVSSADNSPVGQSDELEDGQIATPPPEEESKSAKVMIPPTIKHPLPLKPAFYHRPLNNPNGVTVAPGTKSSSPSSKSIPAIEPSLDFPSPSANLVAANGAASFKPTSLPSAAKGFTPLPIPTSILVNSSAATVCPSPIIATLTEVPQTASSSSVTKESDSVQQLRALKEREADLAAELSRKKELLKVRHQLQKFNSSFASTDKSPASAPVSGASITMVNWRKSPVFDGAKRHERASAVDTFNMAPEIDHVDKALPPAHGLVAAGNCSDTVPGAPRFVEDFLSSLQQQLGAHQPVSEAALPSQSKVIPSSPGIDPSLMASDDRKALPFDNSIVPSSKLGDATRPMPFAHLKDELVPALGSLAQHLQIVKSRSTEPAFPDRAHQSTNRIPSLNTFFPAEQDTVRKDGGGTTSPSSESCVSSAESSVEIFLKEKMGHEFGDAEGSAPDSTKTNSRDERSGAVQDLQPHQSHPWKLSEYDNHSRQLSDRSICKAGNHSNDTRCGLTHCSPAAQNSAPSAMFSSLCYHASDCRDSLCPKVHPRVTTPTPSNSASLSFRTTQTCRYDKQCLRQDCHFKHSWQHSTSMLKPPTSVLKNEEEAVGFSRSPRMTTNTTTAPGPSSTSALSSPSSHVRDASRSDSLPLPISTEAPVKANPHKSISPVPPLATIPAPSPAPVHNSETISHPHHALPQPQAVTRPPAVTESVNGARSNDTLNTSPSRSPTSPPAGPWLIADQLEQYANSARGLRDLSGSPHVLPPSMPTTSLPDSFPSAPLNKFPSPPLFPSFPSCFDGPKAIPLPPPPLSAFTPFDNTDVSLPVASTSSSSRAPPHPSPDIDAPSNSYAATKRPSGPNLPSTPSNAQRGSSSFSAIKTLSSRDERRMKNGKLRDPANPSNLLVPPILNDLLLGVKKLGQKQVQADLDQMKHEDPTGARSEKLGNSVLTSIGWMSPPDRMASKPLSPATFSAFLKQSNLPIPYGLPNEMQTSGNLRRMWDNVLTHPLAKNVYRYCQELVQQRKKVASLEDGGSGSTSTSTKANGGRAMDEHAGLPSKPRAEMATDPNTGERISPIVIAQNRIDHIIHNLVIPIRIIGHVASKSKYRKAHF